MTQYFPVLLYFGIAVLNQLLSQQQVPATPWDWFKWGASALLAGAIAVKAKTSPTDKP